MAAAAAGVNGHDFVPNGRNRLPAGPGLVPAGRDLVPSFGAADNGGAGAGLPAPVEAQRAGEFREEEDELLVEDELFVSASGEKVQEVSEQIAEFLGGFTPDEQESVLAPFLRISSWPSGDAAKDEEIEPHVDEARRFIENFLQSYSDCERDLILEKCSGKGEVVADNASTTPPGSLTPPGSVTPIGSVTPVGCRSVSVTPPGCTTPTGAHTPPMAATPREFLNARRTLADRGEFTPTRDRESSFMESPHP